MVNLHDIPLGCVGLSDAIPALLSIRSSARLLLHVRIAIDSELSRHRRFNADRRDEVRPESVEATAEELPRHLLRSLPGQRLLEALPGHRLLHLYFYLHFVALRCRVCAHSHLDEVHVGRHRSLPVSDSLLNGLQRRHRVSSSNFSKVFQSYLMLNLYYSIICFYYFIINFSKFYN